MVKLTPPARVVVLLTAIVVLSVLLLATAVGASGSGPEEASAEHATHRVVTGDTLWDIAAAYTTPGEDVRRTVFEIKEINGIDGSVILPGQVLQVPIPG